MPPHVVYPFGIISLSGGTMQIVQALYRLSVAFWAGGVAIFTFVLTPALFRSLTRDQAGQIVGLLFPGYFRWGLVCGIVALACRIVMRNNGVATVIIVVMLAIASFQSFYIEPKAAALKREIPSFETTPKDHPLRREFSRLHGVSAVCNLIVLGGGVTLIVLL
jgi:hypothetical protein